MEIIDAQIHQSAPVLNWPPALGDRAHMTLSCELAIAAMDAVGVDVAVIVAATDFCELAVELFPDRFVAAVRCDYRAPDLDQFIAVVRKRPGFLAVRRWVPDWRDGTARQVLRDGGFERLFIAAEKNEVPVFIPTPGYAADLIPVAKAHPKLSLIVDHLGLPQPPPVPADPDPFNALEQLLALAEFENVAVKLSGAPTLSKEPYPHRDLWPYLDQVIAAFGPRRLMWGSDYTRLRYASGTSELAPRNAWIGLYSDSLNYLRDRSELSQDDRAMILGGSIRRILCIGHPR